jgi:hypothetical protein
MCKLQSLCISVNSSSTHHQEHTQQYLKHLVFVKPLLLPAVIVEDLKRQRQAFWQIPDAVDTVVCAPDDGRRSHTKHVEQFTEIYKLCNVVSCFVIIWNHFHYIPLVSYRCIMFRPKCVTIRIHVNISKLTHYKIFWNTGCARRIWRF